MPDDERRRAGARRLHRHFPMVLAVGTAFRLRGATKVEPGVAWIAQGPATIGHFEIYERLGRFDCFGHVFVTLARGAGPRVWVGLPHVGMRSAICTHP